jgi:hypothetical protein
MSPIEQLFLASLLGTLVAQALVVRRLRPERRSRPRR